MASHDFDSFGRSYPRKPQPVKSGAFTYDENGLTAGGISRAPTQDLKLLFRKNASKARIRAATKPWVTAQLQLYGVSFQKSASAVDLKALLQYSVTTGKCDVPAPDIATLEKSLSERYHNQIKAHKDSENDRRAARFSQLKSPSQEARFDTSLFVAKYFLTGVGGQPDKEKQKKALVLKNDCGQTDLEKAVKAIPGLALRATRDLTVIGWEDSFARGLDKAFAILSGPTAHFDIPTTEANFDFDRFMAKYFLDSLHGKPDVQKTPNPIRLCPFFKEKKRLAEAAYPLGLNWVTAEGVDLTYTIVGWDVEKVVREKKKIEDERDQERAEKAARRQAELEEERREILQPHHEYMKTHTPPSGPLNIDQLTGSYVIQSKELENWRHLCNCMTLDICPSTSSHGTTAAFCFALMEGTMLLSLAPDALESLRQEHEADSEEEEEEEEEPDYGGYPWVPCRKRKAKDGTRASSPKRRLQKTPKPNRVYLQWAGEELNSTTERDPDNEQVGYLDFEASTAVAHGQLKYPGFFGDQDVQFSIFKCADKPVKTPKRWTLWSEDRTRWW